MASVWLAERTDLLRSRQVALKLPHGDCLDAHDSRLAERLTREREILATLEHPHIARLYDAGQAADGRPCLAMERVDGEPITRWRQQHGATPRQRVALILQVCEALAYAHARLVVHRDLKPSNIFVDATGNTKLLDFGIAKLLADSPAGATDLTQEGGRPYTPDYAAPEQIAGRPLGVGVDVYALGVLLFELLTDTRPPAAQLRRPDDSLPLPSSLAPAALRGALLGDLDTIVVKALKFDPDERYPSVEALAADLRRHLAHEPVLARPDSRAYRVHRFVRRHRAGVAAASLVALAVLGGTAAALWQAGQARQQRDLALASKAQADQQAVVARRAQRVAEAQTSLADFLLSDAASGQTNQAAAAQIERSLQMIRSQYADDDALRGELLADAAIRLRWIGQDPRAQALFAEAEPLLRAAGAHVGIARILCMRARDLAHQGRFEDGRRVLAEAATELQRGADPTSYAHAGCLIEQAALSRLAGDAARAVDLTEQALASERRAGRGEREFTAEILRSLSRARMEAGRYADAAAAARESLALRDRIGQNVGPGPWQTWNLLGMALRDGGQPLAALQAFGGEGRFDPAGAEQASSTRIQYALGLAALGRADDALRVLSLVRAASAGRGSASELRNTVTHTAEMHIARGELAEARKLLDAAEPQFDKLRSERRAAARAFVMARARLALAAGEPEPAAAALAEARGILQATPSAEPAWRGWHRLSAQSALGQGRVQDAAQAAEAALGIATRLAIDPRASIHIAEDQLLRAQVRHQLRDAAGALSDAEAAFAQARTAGGPAHPWTKDAQALAAALRAGRPGATQ